MRCPHTVLFAAFTCTCLLTSCGPAFQASGPPASPTAAPAAPHGSSLLSPLERARAAVKLSGAARQRRLDAALKAAP